MQKNVTKRRVLCIYKQRYARKQINEINDSQGAHKMRLLQKKILVLVISSILISAMVVMAIAFLNYNHIVEKNSEQIMQLMCSEKRTEHR